MKEEKKDANALFSDALKALQSGEPLEGSDGALTPLIKRLVEASLEGGMDAHLGAERPHQSLEYRTPKQDFEAMKKAA